MTGTWLLGAGIGLLAALGVIIAVRATPPMRPVRLADRIAPYLGDTPPPSRLLARPDATSAPFAVMRRIFGPVLGEAVTLVDRLVGGSVSVRRRLSGLGSGMTLEEFRIEQVLWGAIGTVLGAVVVAAGSFLRGGVDPFLTVLGALAGLLGGVLGRDWFLTRQLEQREQAMLSEFPVVADLLALSVVAGESPVDALERVCRLTGGELARDLSRALARARSGAPVAKALSDLAEQTTMESFARFLQGLVVAIERGTPLADILRAQAVDVREVGKRALLEAGGRKEISMMVPVVFLILPVTVLFALFPGLLTLTSLGALTSQNTGEGERMRLIRLLGAWLLCAHTRVRDRDRERGDVPGWVMVTVMTAILVVAILGIFEPQIKSALSGIIDSVSNSKK